MSVTKFSPLFSLIWKLEILVTFRTLIVELIVTFVTLQISDHSAWFFEQQVLFLHVDVVLSCAFEYFLTNRSFDNLSVAGTR